MDVLNVLICFVLKVSLLWRLTTSQILLEELNLYNIDPLNINGTESYTELTIDQIIMRASGGPGMAQNLMLGDDGSILAELDMRLTQSQFFNLYEQPQNMMQGIPPRRKRALKKVLKKAKRTKRKAIRDTILRWDNGVIPYKFVSGHFDETEKYMIRSAMTEWEKYTCLRFRAPKRSERNIVRFQNGMGCNSQLGMVGGEQALNLDKNGCRYKGLYLHEIGHAIGLVHEHQLPNRDEYIEIVYDKVQPNMRIWFNKYSSQEVDQMKVPYEYSSVMHYGITAFSADGKSQTIIAKQADKEKSIGRVYRKELSFTDVKIVNLMYKCSAHCTDTVVCGDEGYVDQNCKCICPDGTDSCTKDKKEPVDQSCYNAHENWQCYIWANQGECDRNPRFMLDGCKRACHLCGEKETEEYACKDDFETYKCQVWKENGECIVNKVWMEKHCKHTCKACKDSGSDPEVACENKHEKLEECEKWAKEGECQINSRWMPENCRKSCHLCDESGKTTTTTTTTPEPDHNSGECYDQHNSVECKGWADQRECEVNPDWMIPNCRKSCKKCKGTDQGERECKNIWDNNQCEGWARDRECMKNSDWMNTNCHKACSKCSADGDTDDNNGKTQTTPIPTTTTQGSASCKNNHRSDKDCNTWAKYGHCKINQWMLVHCAKACAACKSDDDKPKTTTSKPDKTDTNTNKDEDTKEKPRSCEDTGKHCRAWADHGFCEDNPGTALRICKRTCNACMSDTTDCFDKHQLCPAWASGGQCQRNSGYMLRNCQKSCSVC